MFADGNGQDVVGAHNVARLGDLCPVQAHVPGFNQSGGRGALLDDPGKPQPLVQALRQFFLPII